MDYLNWDIIEDDFNAEDVINKIENLVDCKVNYEGKIYNWCLNHDEYVHYTLNKFLKKLEKTNGSPHVILETKLEIDRWVARIEEREQSEKDAGEDL